MACLGSGLSTATYGTVVAASGNVVYVGGAFNKAGGIPVSAVARWDGQQWSAMGGGVNGHVKAIATFGNDVYLGGSFTQAGGIQTKANGIARWNPNSGWSLLAGGLPAPFI